jgi:hypothetical protein
VVKVPIHAIGQQNPLDIRSDLQRTSNAASGKKNQPELLRLFFRDAIVEVL